MSGELENKLKITAEDIEKAKEGLRKNFASPKGTDKITVQIVSTTIGMAESISKKAN